MRQKSYQFLVGDFETTVYEGQKNTEVWASAVVPFYSEDVKIFHSISETFDYLVSLNTNVCIYYHNLKFDGAFWLSYLMETLEYQQAITQNSEKELDISFKSDWEMKNKTFKYTISNLGQWYLITIKTHDHIIQIRDSLKLLPFTVEKLGDSFKTKHRKLSMQYKGFRYAGCTITDEEKRYIANDVLVVKEALEIMFQQGHDKLTIGSCCLDEFKRTFLDEEDYNHLFPDLYECKLDESIYGSPTVGDYIRNSYKGGWCYVVKGKEKKEFHNGITADVNSLYPSMMSSESGNYYPIGTPEFFRHSIPKIAEENNHYYFVRIKTRFKIRPNKLPCIQIKGNLLYNGREWLETSDIYSQKDNKHYDHYYEDGELKETYVTLTLTCTDYKLIKEHYYLIDPQILDGCWFHTDIGLFDNYINKWKKIKLENTGAIRELAKLFLNNLYGKLASSKNSSFKYAFLREDNSVGFVQIPRYDKQAGYIPIGSAITSYARNFTIRAAQKNYYGKNSRGFIYADTDSIHCDLEPDELVGIQVDSKNFCCWKLESSWDIAYFVRQKTYLERVTKENLKPVDPYYNIKCAGLPEKCKNLFIESLKGYSEETWKTEHKDEFNQYTREEQNFISHPRTIQDFDIGLTIPSKLVPRRIQGGVLLVETTYEMR